GAFDHAVPEHGGPGQAKAGAYKCQDCHKAETSDRASDVLVPDIAKCNACHGAPKTKTAAATDADCASCHSFHAPGKASPKPGHPALETLRWSEMTAKKPDADRDGNRKRRPSRSGVPEFSDGLEGQTTPKASMASATFLKPA